MAGINILVINTGSSSLKAAFFSADGSRTKFYYPTEAQSQPGSFDVAFRQLFQELDDVMPDVVAHRFVHSGNITESVRLVNQEELARLEQLTPLAPLHISAHLQGIKYCIEHFNKIDDIPQLVCFDNAFHSSMPEIAYRLPIPNYYQLRRYGFHGLNYAHVARQLPQLLGSEIAQGRIVVAHLGSGSSLCLLEKLKSADTSMGYSTAGGIPMATRSGDLDPGVMLALSQHLDYARLHDLVFHGMGLLALSNGESSDMKTLLESNSPSARFAIDYFARSVRAGIGAYAAKAGGIDALVFTGGVGEHAAYIRQIICDPLAFLGFQLQDSANSSNFTWLSNSNSKPILLIPADEEAEIAQLAVKHINHREA